MRRSEQRALIRCEVTRMLRDPLSWAAGFAFALFLGLGAWFYWRALPPRPGNGRLFGEAFVLALVVGWHAGLARDRASRFDIYLAANFVSPRALYVGKVCSALAFVLGLSLVAFALASATSAGDFGYAAHYTTLFLLASLLLLPGVILLELLLNTRYPVPLLLLLVLGVLVIYSRVGDVQRLNRFLGLDGNIDLVPALLRSAAALAITAALFPLYRIRLGGPRLAALVDSS